MKVPLLALYNLYKNLLVKMTICGFTGSYAQHYFLARCSDFLQCEISGTRQRLEEVTVWPRNSPTTNKI